MTTQTDDNLALCLAGIFNLQRANIGLILSASQPSWAAVSGSSATHCLQQLVMALRNLLSSSLLHTMSCMWRGTIRSFLSSHMVLLATLPYSLSPKLQIQDGSDMVYR
jgi:hypothetical protein